MFLIVLLDFTVQVNQLFNHGTVYLISKLFMLNRTELKTLSIFTYPVGRLFAFKVQRKQKQFTVYFV